VSATSGNGVNVVYNGGPFGGGWDSWANFAQYGFIYSEARFDGTGGAMTIWLGVSSGSTVSYWGDTNSGFYIEDIGPVTRAAVNPPAGQPTIATAGNALGIVAMGSLNATDTSIPANTPTQVTANLSATLLTGRRYRVFFACRAYAGNVMATMTATLRDGTTAIPNASAPYSASPGNNFYQAIAYQWIFDGDGTTKSLNVAVTTGQTAVTAYTAAQGYFYVEDVGPNQAPALPIPDTPPGWTPPTMQNSWVSNTSYPAGYRKIGDVVSLRGNVNGGTNNTTCFTLPVGFRPPFMAQMIAYQYAGGIGWCQLYINPNGAVTLQALSGTAQNVSLDNVSFSVTP